METLKPINITDYYLDKCKTDQDKYIPLIFDLITNMTSFEKEDTFKKIKAEMGYSIPAIRDEFAKHQKLKGSKKAKITLDGKEYTIPENYIINDSGIGIMTSKGVEKITNQKIFIKGIAFDIVKDYYYLQLAFDKNGKVKTFLVQKSEAYHSQKIIQLSNYGMDVHSGNSQAIVSYLVAFNNENENIIDLKSIEDFYSDIELSNTESRSMDQHRNNFFNVEDSSGSIKTVHNNYGKCYGYVFKSDLEQSIYDIGISKAMFNNIVKKWGNKNSERSLLLELKKKGYIKTEKNDNRIRKKIDGETKSLIYFTDFQQHLK